MAGSSLSVWPGLLSLVWASIIWAYTSWRTVGHPCGYLISALRYMGYHNPNKMKHSVHRDTMVYLVGNCGIDRQGGQ
jgi:hypothetical protein